MDQELRDYFDRRFDEVGRRFEGMESRLEGMESRLGGVESQLAEVRQDMASQFAEVKDEIHQTRILVEKLNDKIDLVAEGVQANTEVMHRHREENRQELREFRSLMEASHRHLDGRVSAHDVELEQLDNRVTFLEARKA